MNSAWLPLEHKIFRFLKEQQLLEKRFLLALSGGRDSVALLHILKALRLSVSCAYVHHGGVSDYRQQAAQFCKKRAHDLQIPFYLLGPATEDLKSEEEMRQFRYQQLRDLKEKENFDFIVVAHHQQDLLETRVLRLIRGTGLQGIVGMKTIYGEILRPLLGVSDHDIQSYVQLKKMQFIEDPSNKDSHYLRNWLRNEWLPMLEDKIPGGLEAFSRSLELLSNDENQSLPEELWLDQGLSRVCYLSLSVKEQRQALTQLLLKQGRREFSYSQILEIQKYLDNPQKDLTFRVAKCDWQVNAEQIFLL